MVKHHLWKLIVAVTLAVTLVAPGISAASMVFDSPIPHPPTNDYFSSATSVTSLPFSDAVDMTNTTTELNEPMRCYSVPQTIWYSYTPDAEAVVTVNLNGSNFSDTNLVVYQANSPDFSGLSFMSCTSWGNSLTFHAYPGARDYIQVGKIYAGGGIAQINIQVLAPPANDNFANAASWTNSYSESVDVSAATTEADEILNSCYNSVQNTIWYVFIAPSSGAVIFSANNYYSNMNAYLATGSGLAGLSFINCAPYGSSTMIQVQAGATYYFQAGTNQPTSNSLYVSFQFYPAPTNDDFANAQVVATLPFDGGDTNMQAASVETGEPTPSCADPYSGTLNKTIWYSYAPAQSDSITARSDGSNVLGVYTGDSLTSLTEVGCRQYGNPLTIHVNSGTKYYFQAGTLSNYGVGFLHVYLEVAPSPTARFYYYPYDPNMFDTINFYDSSNDPVSAGFQSWSWNFGDGTTAAGQYASHRYAKDGEYTVKLTIITTDGRIAATTQIVHVKTHDVAITQFNVPKSGKVGNTEKIVVGINSKLSVEDVQVQLFKSTPSGYQLLGTLQQSVPVRPRNKTTDFLFSYTFTSDDGAIGKVTFKAVATIVGARDALPADNEAIGAPTKVTKK